MTKDTEADRPLHGGPVSPWPRRVRRFIRGCTALVFTCALTVVVSVIGLTGITALGGLPTSLGLLITAVVVYAIAGLRPLTVALACATVLAIFTAGSETARFEVDHAFDAFTQALELILR